jgi:two-component system phosphate regulon response regulator PhoB
MGRPLLLVVEDDTAIRSMLVDLLADEGYTVIACPDGDNGLVTLLKVRPDVVVLDMMLPSMSGWQFLERSRRQREHAGVPVIVVSAIDGRSDYPTLLGVAAWFSKPLNVPRFLRTIEQLTSRPRAAQTTPA